MKRSLGLRSALIFVAVGLTGHFCLGQVSPPPPPPTTVPAQTAPATATTAGGEATPAPAKDAPIVPVIAASDEAGKEAKLPGAIAEPEARAPDPAKEDTGKGGAGKGGTGKNALIGNPYVIGTLDVLEVKIWKAGNLNGIYAVGQDGAIVIPLLGRIRADGLTEDQVASSIRDGLAEHVFVEPPNLNEITVTVVRNNSKKYTVFGAVGHPGEFPLQTAMTVMDVLANCGGFQPFAKTTKIYILRDGKPQIKFNFKEVITNKNMKQNIQVQNGDRIIVPE